MYKIYNIGEVKIIHRISDGASIPFNEANTDYQTYLAWIAEGNEAEEVEE